MIVDDEGFTGGRRGATSTESLDVWGEVDASIGEYGLHHVHTYLGKVDQSPDVENTVSIHSAVRAMQEECFSGIATMASLALASSWAADNHSYPTYLRRNWQR